MRRKALSLEDYVAFQENPASSDLTTFQLNQIISMHGFNKLQRRTQEECREAASSINLVVPRRSTLTENVCSAPLTLEEVKKDADSLGWKECVVQSIHALKHDLCSSSFADGGATHTLINNDSNPPPICSSSTSGIVFLPSVATAPKSSSKRKRKSIHAPHAAASGSQPAPA